MDLRRKTDCPVCHELFALNRRGELVRHNHNGLYCPGSYLQVADRMVYSREPLEPTPAEKIAALREAVMSGKLDPSPEWNAEEVARWTMDNLRSQI